MGTPAEASDLSLTSSGAPPNTQPTDEPRAAAPGGWFYYCKVNRTGPAEVEDGTVFIHLRESSGKFDGWYSATPSVKREMLATALVALTSNKPVDVLLTTTTEYGVINRLYVRA